MNKKEALELIKQQNGYICYITLFDIYNDEDDIPNELIQLYLNDKKHTGNCNFIICSPVLANGDFMYSVTVKGLFGIELDVYRYYDKDNNEYYYRYYHNNPLLYSELGDCIKIKNDYLKYLDDIITKELKEKGKKVIDKEIINED